MKKTLLFVAVALLATACEKVSVEEPENQGQTEQPNVKTKKFKFTVKGDFLSPTFTRAASYLTADDNDMTDLWVFDFVGNECVQSIHQTASDEDWGQPTLPLAYGDHHVYFVASRGQEPTLNETTKTIVWSGPRDTFWKDYEVTVVTTSNGNRAVTLDRVVTKLKVTATDDVKTGASTLSVTPAFWYYGLNYTTGEPVDGRANQERSVSIPTSYIGTTGTLTMNVFGFSSATEWTTNVTVTAKNSGGETMGTATITDAPMLRNRATEYSGPIFGSEVHATVSVNKEWMTSTTGTW